MKILQKAAFFSALALVAAGCGKQTELSMGQPGYNYTRQMKVGGQNLLVEVVKTPDAMSKGLSDRVSMPENQGMLFDFGNDVSEKPGFWMMGMEFPLDFIWIKDKKIVGITDNVAPPLTCKDMDDCKKLNGEGVTHDLPQYYPPSPINWVLEVNAGWARKNNIKVGASVAEQD